MRKVFNDVKNGTSLAQAQKKHRYSESYHKVNPNQITEKKSWQVLLEEELPDEMLTKTHLEGLKQADIRKAPIQNSKYKYLELAYKLKGRLNTEKDKPQTLIAIIEQAKTQKEEKRDIIDG